MKNPRIRFTPQPLPPITAADQSPLPDLVPALIAGFMILAIFATIFAVSASGVGLVEW